VLVLALALGLPLLSRRRREQRWRGWQRQARTALDTGRLTERLLPVSAVEINDTEGWRTTGAQVEQAARGLDTVADSAPKPVGASAAHQAARDLRNLSLALESARVARAQTPSTVDLAAAETACQDRRLDLDAAFSQLEGVVAGTGP